uniref:Protein FAM117A-like n=1 Tax=Gouania willdenowi TaxID=441366 RepID=A0A8C5HJC9_GOUWI
LKPKRQVKSHLFVSLKADRNAARPPKPTIRRTLSLDAIVGPYLQGHWPKEAEGTAVICVNDKATQTPSSWAEETRGRRSVGGHKRSASCGSAEHLRETMPLMPLNRLAPRLRRSVEGLNMELEEVFVSEKPEDQHEIRDIPDGHRAPVPSPCLIDPSLLTRSSSSSPLNPLLLSPCQSPSSMGTALLSSPLSGLPSFALEPLLLPPCSSSPRPNKTYSFQREPPEGCERVRLCDEAMSSCPEEPVLQPSCPDPNKVNFTPHGGSAFCPVSLLKPLLPSMDLLFRGLSVSPLGLLSSALTPWQCAPKTGMCGNELFFF